MRSWTRLENVQESIYQIIQLAAHLIGKHAHGQKLDVFVILFDLFFGPKYPFVDLSKHFQLPAMLSNKTLKRVNRTSAPQLMNPRHEYCFFYFPFFAIITVPASRIERFQHVLRGTEMQKDLAYLSLVPSSLTKLRLLAAVLLLKLLPSLSCTVLEYIHILSSNQYHLFFLLAHGAAIHAGKIGLLQQTGEAGPRVISDFIHCLLHLHTSDLCACAFTSSLTIARLLAD